MRAIYKDDFNKWIKSQEMYSFIDSNPLLRAIAENAWEAAKEHSAKQYDSKEKLVTALNYASKMALAAHQHSEEILEKIKDCEQ